MTGPFLSTLSKGISSNPEVMNGKPCVHGTRITVEIILRRFAEDYTLDQLLDDYPVLTPNDVKAALSYAAKASAVPHPEPAG
jgi:uncharacterized protein (DUF433 family)